VGVRAIKYWKRRAKGDMHLALAAYNCGNAGLDKKCGVGYANQVLSRKIRRKRENEEECSALANLINFLIDNRKYLKKPLQASK
jgi:soluble lytic murein transglycosylase-like protein